MNLVYKSSVGVKIRMVMFWQQLVQYKNSRGVSVEVNIVGKYNKYLFAFKQLSTS